jgi:arginine exporter protein ArgO
LLTIRDVEFLGMSKKKKGKLNFKVGSIAVSFVFFSLLKYPPNYHEKQTWAAYGFLAVFCKIFGFSS